MKFKDLRQAIIDQISLALPDLQVVDTHPGGFDLEELERIGTQTPAVRIALLGSNTVNILDTGENEIVLDLAVYIITADQRLLPKEESALAIVEGLVLLIPGQRWGLSGVFDASNIQVQNLFSADIERQGVALWSITWQQSIRLGADTWVGGVLPSEVYVCGDSENFGNEPAYDQVV